MMERTLTWESINWILELATKWLWVNHFFLLSLLQIIWWLHSSVFRTVLIYASHQSTIKNNILLHFQKCFCLDDNLSSHLDYNSMAPIFPSTKIRDLILQCKSSHTKSRISRSFYIFFTHRNYSINNC